MRFALLISAAFHGLILVSLIGIQFEDQQIEEEKQISGPEVISFEEHCDLIRLFKNLGLPYKKEDHC